MARKNPRRNIVRIETFAANGKLVSGWQVRMQRRGRRYEKLFSDSLFDGKRRALQAARAYRDELESELEHYSVKELARKPSGRNRSGIVGVRLVKQTDVRGDYQYTYYFWVAQWTDGNGKRKTRSFSCHRYGDREAFRMAVAARQAGITRANR